MRAWNQVPLFRLLLPFLAGILLEIFYPLHNQIFLLILPVLLSIVLLFTYNKKIYRKIGIRWIYGTALNLVILVIGATITFYNSDKNSKNHFSNLPDTREYLGVLADQLHEKKNSYKTIVEIKSVRSVKGAWRHVNGNVLLYLEKDVSSAKLKYGDAIIFSAAPKEVELPKNPDEFNYKRFLSFHNVYHQAYLAKNKWKSLNYNDGNPLRRYSYELRDRLVEIFKTKIIREQEYGVASALVLGYEDNIDAELINAYSSAGALHVLSVSGMHVAIIFIVFNWMLSWMDKNKWLRHLKFIFLVLFIWFYAMLTGFSPAVLRSAMMISVVIIGSWSNRNSNIFNTLIASAFVLLVYNPYLITEVGFQLSYLAVFGICYLYPMIAKWFEFSNWLMHNTWKITAVSISAQLMTFPLGLLYFHQFPNLFFISNLIVIPLSTVIIYLCILLLAVSSLPVFVSFMMIISKYISVACFGLLYILNSSVLLTEKIPYSVLSGISISVFETWIIYLLMAMLVFFLVNKRPVYLIAGLAFTLILCVSQISETIQFKGQKKIIVYAVAKESAYDFITPDENYFVADSDLINDKSKMMFHIIHNRWALGMNKTMNMEMNNSFFRNEKIFRKNNFIQFYNKKILILRDKFSSLYQNEVKEKL
ncbi:MAG TPA: ComEC/Rec2 family competence protein, partial [Bacteroidia bacterium]|nr:ComEC/Rec2 family competence protein [Bacteroidia bacterium]